VKLIVIYTLVQNQAYFLVLCAGWGYFFFSLSSSKIAPLIPVLPAGRINFVESPVSLVAGLVNTCGRGQWARLEFFRGTRVDSSRSTEEVQLFGVWLHMSERNQRLLRQLLLHSSLSTASATAAFFSNLKASGNPYTSSMRKCSEIQD